MGEESVISLHKRCLMSQRAILFLICVLSVGAAMAQEKRGNLIEDPLFPAPRHTYATPSPDTTSQSPAQSTYDYYSPYYGGLHEGVNVRIDLTAMAGFGSGAPHGAGFGRSIDFVYVSPIKNKWNYTLGLNSTGMNWGGLNYNDAGISGSVNYYPTENISLSLYGYKSLLSNTHNRWPHYYGWGCAPYYWGGFPYGLGGFPYYGDSYGYWGSAFAPYGGINYWRPNSYIGGDLNVRFNNNTWLEVHVGAGRWE